MDTNTPELTQERNTVGQQLANASVGEAILLLREWGYPEHASRLEALNLGHQASAASEEEAATGKIMTAEAIPPHAYTSHVYGYIPLIPPGSTDLVPIQDARNIDPDPTLENTRIKVTLDGLFVWDYPGGGVHQVLFKSYGRNQLASMTEKVHFAQTYSIGEEQGAGITGYPIFVGLTVGSEGVDFAFETINVSSSREAGMLQLLDSGPFKEGLELIKTAQPAIGPLSDIALGFTRMLLKNSENKLVQQVTMGLDFSNVSRRARLAEGSYVVIQVFDERDWEWARWKFDPSRGQLVLVHPNIKWARLTYNYFVFGVSRYRGK